MNLPFFSRLFRSTPRPAPPADGSGGFLGLPLEALLKTSFFTWFSLEQVSDALPAGEAVIRRYQPSGPAFHRDVVVEVETGADGLLRAMRLNLARRFIDHPSQGIFASDIAGSFLCATPPADDQTLTRDLAGEISAKARTDRPLIVAKGSRHGEGAGQPDSPGYLVYLGRAGEWETRNAYTRAFLRRQGEGVQFEIESR